MTVAGWRRWRTACLCLIVAVALVTVTAGCSPGVSPSSDTAQSHPSTETLARGVVHRSISNANGGGLDVVDLDLSNSDCIPAILSNHAHQSGSMLIGTAREPKDWLQHAQAVAVVNGGYFGAEDGSRKQIVGLCVNAGKVMQHAPPLTGKGGAFVAAGQYVRSAFGVDDNGQPSIEWAATPTKGGSVVYTYTRPTSPSDGKRWRVSYAIGCGPTLIRSGRNVVTAHEERLASDIPTERTFVAYDRSAGRAVHFAIGITSPMTYSEAATAIGAYFADVHHSKVDRAMCLDGGSSSQLSYRSGSGVVSPRATMVTVPDAVAIVPISWR